MQRKLMVFTVAAALLGNSLVAVGQQRERTTVVAPPQQGEVEEFFIAQGPAIAPPPPIEMRGDNMIFLATEMSFAGKLVKGAPYSAQAVTESVQQLADGNRIVRKNTAQVYRDGEGRTRREQTLGYIGPYATSGDVPQTVFINDPVAGVHYILDPAKKTARKLPRVELRVRADAEGRDKAASEAEAAGKTGERRKLVQTETHKIEIERSFSRVPGPDGPAAPPAPPTVIVTQTGEGEGATFMRYSSKYESKTEKLEARSFDGVMAEGTRTTTTIPAGDLGNEQPINIVDERWYSPELQVVVMTRHSDPRAGETTYRLTNIARAEPAAALFQVPSDYAVRDNTAPTGVRRTFRRAPPPPPQQEN